METILIMAGVGLAIMSCGVALAEKQLSVPASSVMTENGSDYPEVINGIRERAEAQTGKKWIEPADSVLIQRGELEWSRYLKTAMNLPDWVDLGIENRTRFESYDHPWRSTQKNGEGRTDPQIALRSRVRFGLGNGPGRFLFEGQDSRSYLNNDPGDFVNNTTVNEWDILQLFGSITLDNFLGIGLRTDLHFGRMTLDFGNRRFIARNDFRNTTNAFDGVHWQIGQRKTWRFRAFFVEPVIRDEVKLDEQNKHTLFWGAYLENHQIPWLKFNTFYFGLNDQQPQNNNLHRTYSTFGLRVFKLAAVNEFDYEFDGAIQTGGRGGTDHFAYNPNVQFGYTFNIPWTPRFLVQYVYASGTRTPGGSQSGDFDPLFGARRFDLMPSGTFGPFLRSNISSPGWRLIVNPDKNWKVQVKHRFWYLAQSRALYVTGEIQDSTGNSGNFLGHDLEFHVQWALSENLDFDLGYDHWFKGSYFDRLPASANLPAGGDKDTDYFYFSMRVRL